MVRLSYFDVRDQVPTGACVLDVWHGDHQVIEGGALGLFGLAELLGGAATVTTLKNKLRIHQTLPAHLFCFWPAADLQTLTFTDGHLETERNPDMAQVLHPRIKGEALHAAQLLAAESR